jgi:lipoprotein signal peptidase
MGNIWTPIPALDWVRIVGSYNTGTACGFFPQLSIVFTLAPFFILAVVIWFYRSQKNPSWLLSVGVGLIIGGAFGNLVDRLRLGYVVDFVSVAHLPVFNVADFAVSTAVVIMLLWSLREDSSRPQAVTTDATGESDQQVKKDSSWKLGLVFIGILGLVIVGGYFICVILPANLL